MNDATRRGFLTLAGAGAVAGAAAVAAPSAGAAVREDESVPAGAPAAMSAYVKNVRRGEVLLMIEDREVVITDRALAARLSRAFHRAATS